MRYFAYRLPDLKPLHGAVDLRGVSLYRAINEPGELRGTLDKAQAYEQMVVEGESSTVRLMRDYGTLIVADDGTTARAFIVDFATQAADHQDRLTISAVGFGQIPHEQPWLGPTRNFVDADPLHIVRTIWVYLSGRDGSVGVTVAGTRSPVRIGEPSRRVEFTTGQGESVEFESGPYRLSWWQAEDLKKRLDDLAEETPFEWREVTRFDRENDDPPQLHIDLGYPRLESAVRDNLHFTVGVNVHSATFEDEADWFSDVLVIGNGEGEAQKRGEASRRRQTRQKRVKLIEDNSLMSDRICRQVAQREVDRADREGAFIESCTVTNHPAAPLHAFDIGDTITIKGRYPWGDHEQDCRVLSIDHNIAQDSYALGLGRLPE